MPKGARNVFLNESEDSRNVLGEFQQVCKRWTSIKDRDFAAVGNVLVLSFRKQRPFPSFISSQVHIPHRLLNYSEEYFHPKQQLAFLKLLRPHRRRV